jgi:signal transduction histidine kinase/ActR/RegA family two-component response regulator
MSVDLHRFARFVDEASRRLASSAERDVALASLAALVASEIADGCLVHIIEDGALKLFQTAWSDPTRQQVFLELERTYQAIEAPTWGPRRVAATGMGELLSRLPASALHDLLRRSSRPDLVGGLEASSVVCVPLTFGQQTLGTLTLWSFDTVYGPEEATIAEAIGRTAALVIENSRLSGAAVEANRLRDAFLSALSHELRTPLAGILIWTQLLRSGDLDPDAMRRALEMIERGTRSLEQTIEELLDMSRILSGGVVLDVGPVDLAAAVQQAAEAARPKAASRNVQIVCCVDPDSGPIRGDAARLQQALSRLVAHGLRQAGDGGSIEITLDSVAERARLRLRACVSRSGGRSGSAEAERPGAGVALTVARRIVELHGGSLVAETTADPIVEVLLPPTPLADAESERSAPAVRAWTRPVPVDGVHVLLVDDDADARDALRLVLERSGANVQAVSSGREALDALACRRPDVLLCDLAMPEEDGYAVIRKVRQLGPECGGNIPAVAVTAYASREDRARALDAGFQEHVPKPVDPARLLAVIGALTREARPHA